MTVFPSRFRLFRTLASLGLPLLTWLLLVPTEAVSRPRESADEPRTVEVLRSLRGNPLAPDEIVRGRQVADSSDQIKRARVLAATLPRPPRLRLLLQDVHPLYTQRHIEAKNADPQSRRAEVFYFNYATNEVIQTVVNLNSNTVQETQVASGVANHPFFSRAEIKAALQLVFEHPQLGPSLRTAYREITGQSLTDVSQLEEAQGGVFYPASAARTPLGNITADCAVDRCMQLFVPIGDLFIDMSKLVVDLSTGEVLGSISV
ncbi:hypothetical protein [Methyloglobulus sp.]|uniref:hypothetical protein n=1 Tax=Methyloglobulus sp. TaxID=2518622 RepID=UPI00398A16C7